MPTDHDAPTGRPSAEPGARSPDLSRRRFVLDGAVVASAALALTGPATAAVREASDPPAPGGDGGDGNADRGDAPPVTPETIAAAAALNGLRYTAEERAMLARSLADRPATLAAMRPRELPNALAPAEVLDVRAGRSTRRSGDGPITASTAPARPLPTGESTIAFAPVTDLAAWMAAGELTSERLTRTCLDRIDRLDPTLRAVITATRELALEQAATADAERAAGRVRSILHGIPYGAKDLFDTAGIRTTWGAMPFRDRVADTDAIVVERMRAAGAVLVAKTTLGALAYGDQWFGGRTRNPWNLRQGSSGSSAGSCAGVAAGLFPVALGTETYGSIVSPSMRCGTVGLRPTFGRVARTGAMALCWSLDKIGPIARTSEDALHVLAAIHGADPGDPSSVNAPLTFDGNAGVRGLRLGYDPAWFEGRGATDLDRAALEAMGATGVELVRVTTPDLPPGAELLAILEVEAAAAFESLTISDLDDDLTWQAPQAWPNTFRGAWLRSAVDLVQASRRRRLAMDAMDALFEGIDGLVGPSFASDLLLVTNMTGHPSLTVPVGFRSTGRPHGVTFWGRLDDEGTLVRLGMALESRMGLGDRRPGLD